MLILTVGIVMLWGSLLKVQASSFTFNATAENQEAKVGDTVKIDMQISKIEAKEGINVVEANLEYDKTIFESITFQNENKWTTTYHKEGGKFVTIKLVEGVTQEEKIGQIQLKVKNNIKTTETEIKINQITSNNGTELINEGSRTIKIKIVNNGSNGGANNSQNGASNGGQSTTQNGEKNNEQDATQNGEKNNEQDATQNGEKNNGQDATQNGEKNNGQNATQNRGKNNGQIATQNGTQNKKANPVQTITVDEEGPKTMETTIGDNLKTGDKIVLVALAAFIIIAINVAYFMIKGNQLKKEGKENSKKIIIIAIAASLFLMMMVIFLTKDVIAFEGESDKEGKYLVKDTIISGIKPETTVEMFEAKQKGISVKGVTNKTEIVRTGMIGEDKESGKSYELSVLGDINGDGLLNQIDLTRVIREMLECKNWRIEKEVQKVSADVTGDGKINEEDIKSIIKYILYGELENTNSNTNTEEIAEKTDGTWIESKKVNSPNLMEGMTAVYWDESNQEKTLTTNSSSTEWNNWYNYIEGDNVTDTKTSKWANAKTSDGSYFVWIPRYEYKLTERGEGEAAGKIEVKFIPTSQTTADEGYKIHPAFQDGTSNNFMRGEWDSELAGIWVAKYESSHSDATATSEGSSTTLKVVPNVPSWRNITIGDSYTTAYNYDRNKESHMMKNSEWGAVAYLTHSQYGRNRHEIDINNSSTYITGNGGGSIDASEAEGITNAYNTAKGMQASTTGNIYGIYDLSGGAWERVSAYISNGHENLKNYGSSFAYLTADSNAYKIKSTKYATVYPYDSSDDDNEKNYDIYKSLNYGYGDAILETSTTGWRSRLV